MDQYTYNGSGQVRLRGYPRNPKLDSRPWDWVHFWCDHVYVYALGLPLCVEETRYWHGYCKNYQGTQKSALIRISTKVTWRWATILFIRMKPWPMSCRGRRLCWENTVRSFITPSSLLSSNADNPLTEPNRPWLGARRLPLLALWLRMGDADAALQGRKAYAWKYFHATAYPALHR